MNTTRTLVFVLAISCTLACSSKDKSSSKPEVKKVEVPPGPLDTSVKKEPVVAKATLPSDESAPFATDPKVRTGTLDNGLVYYIRANHFPEKRAEFWLSVDTGSFQEDEDQRGLAHFVEHMAFNGTKSFPKNELVSTLQELGVDFGAHLNASTSFDETIYKLRLPTEDEKTIDLGFHILSEWAGSILFDDKEVDGERGVVLAEKRSRDGAQMRLMKGVIQQVFEGTRYAERLPIGLPKVLKGATTATIRKFYNDWYHPENMAVYVVGDIDVDAMEAKIKEQFGPLVQQEKPRQAEERKFPVAKELKFLSLQDKELPIQAVAIGRLFPAQATKTLADFRKSYLEIMTVQMLSKRLDEAQLEGKARYMMAGGAPAPLVRSARILAFLAVVKPDDVQGGLEDLLREVERARRFGFTQGEYDRATKELLSSIRSSAKEDAAGKENSGALVQELTRHHLTGEGMPGRAMELAIFENFQTSVKVTEFTPVLKEFLQLDGLIAAVIGNNEKGALTRADFAKALKEVAKKELSPYAEEAEALALMAKEPTPGTILKSETMSEIGVEHWTLSNGAHVYLKNTDFREDQVLFRASSAGGRSTAAADKLPAIRNAVAAVEVGGLGALNKVALGKKLAGVNVSLGAFIGEYEEGLSGESGSEDLESLMQMAHLKFVAPRKDEKAFAIYKADQIEATKLASSDPETRFRRKMVGFLDNADPRKSAWDEKAATAIELEASFAFYQERFRDAGDFSFYFVGKVDKKKLEALVLRYIASIPDTGKRETIALRSWAAADKASDLQVKDGTQPRATLVFSFEKNVSAEVATPKARLAWRMVGEAMQMRFLDRFREEMAATYGVSVRTRFDQRWTQAEMQVAFQCEPARAEELRKAALAEIASLSEKGVSADHFAKAKASMQKRNESAMLDNAHWLSSLSSLHLQARGLSEILEDKKRIEAVTLADLKAAQASFVAIESVATAVLLPKK